MEGRRQLICCSLVMTCTALTAAARAGDANADVATESAQIESINSDVRSTSFAEPTQPEQWFDYQNAGGGHHQGHARRGLADKHAPAGLMAGHIHKTGELMVEYKYMNMYMDDNRIGSNTVPDSAVLPAAPGGFGVDGIATNNGATPTQMTMEMHMIHLMYGLTDNVSVYTMLMLPSVTMDHTRGPMNPAGFGTTFRTHNSGIGDTGFGAVVSLYEDEDDDLMVNLGFSVPTGDIYRTSSNPTGGALSQALPYPMRLGSGTFNARPGITWKHFEDYGSLGVQFQTDLPMGRNYRGYSVSDIYQLNTWYSHLITDNLALSVRLENAWKSDYDGADPAAPNGVVSTNVESFRGGYWMNLGLGVMALVDGHLFNVEFVPTVYQDLHGVQLETDWTFVASWSKTLK